MHGQQIATGNRLIFSLFLSRKTTTGCDPRTVSTHSLNYFYLTIRTLVFPLVAFALQQVAKDDRDNFFFRPKIKIISRRDIWSCFKCFCLRWHRCPLPERLFSLSGLVRECPLVDRLDDFGWRDLLIIFTNVTPLRWHTSHIQSHMYIAQNISSFLFVIIQIIIILFFIKANYIYITLIYSIYLFIYLIYI